jgi:heptosyltransferase-2
VLLGSPDDAGFAADMTQQTNAPVQNLVGRTSLRGLVAAIADSTLVISQDSGPMHVAAALDKPLIAVFGPTNPARTGPYSARARVVQRPIACAPCYRRQCPLGHHDCLRKLAPEQVLAAVTDAWHEAGRTLVKPLS